MIKSSRWHFRYIAGKVIMGLVLTAIISSINVAPSYGNDGYRGGRGDHHHHRHGHWHDRGRYRYYDDGYRELIYVDYGYRERVYVPPPPVYYAPPPPTIGVFFPPIVIRP